MSLSPTAAAVMRQIDELGTLDYDAIISKIASRTDRQEILDSFDTQDLIEELLLRYHCNVRRKAIEAFAGQITALTAKVDALAITTPPGDPVQP